MFPYLLSIAVPLYFFLLKSNFSLAINSPGFYPQQLDHILVNCGSSSKSTSEDARQWTGDIGSYYTTSLHGSKSKLISSKATDQPLHHDPIPYATARLSRWPFTYTFRVTPGQKLIRLHFYPTSYRGGFKRSKAFFTVKAGPYTLLSNFSASLTVDALGLQYIVKEYYVRVDEDQPLALMFSPSQSSTSDEVYAFVNGIEIISIPAALYHTRECTPAAQIIGEIDRFTIHKSIALEKVHRLNVGGSSISSIEDTGMFRDWDEDSNYLLEKSTVKSATTTIRIKYTSIPPYTAPQKVYQTSWSLVPDKQANRTEFNFTWRLPVDLGFRYLLRLHFCELEYEIKESGRMEFSIFVNEQVVEAKGDLIKWIGGSGVALYRDYVVMMEGDRMEGKRDLLIVLRPNNREWMEPIDAVLKGLEVFKLSNPDKNLAGVNPVLLACASTSPKPKKLVFASAGNAIATGVVILLTLLNIIVYQLRSLSDNSLARSLSENSLPRNLSLSTLEGLCRHFSLAELISATNNFDDELAIGSGGFGKVYKALIDDGATTVALKRLNEKSKQGAKEFWTEIEMLSKLRHTHLVSLLGYCDERNEMILVYEFMEQGTLADHLYKIKRNNGIVGHMPWEQRLSICIGAARGLDYLHTGIRHGIIHRDVKTTNILLDKDWIAKISDFGLCKLGSTSHSHTHISTDVKGSFGYFDPEYFLTRRLTKKSDVYAFGVVMLEVLCGRPAVDTQVEEEQHSLVRWAQQSIKENKLDQLIDPRLRDQISPHCLKVFAEVANNCLDSHPKGRPTMADVVVRLECALASENNHFGSLAQGNAPSSSTLALYNENTQGQHRSKGNVSKVFQRAIEILAKGADINWKKKKTYLQSTAISRRDPEEWMRYRRLTEDLQQGVRHFVHNRWLATQRVPNKTNRRGLSADLRRDIQHHLRLGLVRRVPFLLEMDDQLLDALCERLVSSLSTKGTYILREGYPVTKMLFIIKGSLESFAKNFAGTGLFDSIMLGPGDFCGEELLAWAFLSKSTITLPSSGRTIRALVKVKAFALKAEDLRFVATQFRRLHREKMQHTFRFYSKNWRTWATCIIQAAWRCYKRRRLTKGLTAVESFAESQTRQEAEQDGSPKNSSRFHVKLKLGVIVPKFSDQLVPALQKPEEPDFCAESEPDFYLNKLRGSKQGFKCLSYCKNIFIFLCCTIL